MEALRTSSTRTRKPRARSAFPPSRRSGQPTKPQLEDTTLSSPCDGRVVYLGCATGQQVGAYDTVCVVTDDADLVLKTETIPESVRADAVEMFAQIDGERRRGRDAERG